MRKLQVSLGSVWARLRHRVTRVLRSRLLLGAGVATATVLFCVHGVSLTPVQRPGSPASDPGGTAIAGAGVIEPTQVGEIVTAIRRHPGPVSIAGGSDGSGGALARERVLHIDLRRFNRILEVDTAARTITVQAGATWREIQEHIDPLGLSVGMVHLHDDLTVGGSLAANVPGGTAGRGPLIQSVRSFEMVLADGRVVGASPRQNPDLFYGAIGGYGALGVITQVTLDLAENVRVKRQNQVMPMAAYAEFFRESIRGSDRVLHHSAELYPEELERLNAVSYLATEEPLTEADRPAPGDGSDLLPRLAYRMVSGWPMGEELREHLLDPLVFRREPVTWRSYAAGSGVPELEVWSRRRTGYALQEYFVPVERFVAFVPEMREILAKHDVEVINVSVRHANPDPGSLLAWAPREMFGFAVYSRQGRRAEERARVAAWTREMIDAATRLGGTYFLPHQPHASYAQFLRAYPRAPEFFALKRRVDPGYKFRSRPWDRYYREWLGMEPIGLPDPVRERLASAATPARPAARGYLAHPRRYIVHSAGEYAEWIRDRLPTTFPYAESAGRFWVDYLEARRLAEHLPPDRGAHLMVGLAGSAFSVEMALKALYESTAGRASGWTSGGRLSAEDELAHEVAADYARFVEARPWYEYDFVGRLRELWADVPLMGEYPIRKWERRLFLSTEYGVKAIHGKLAGLAARLGSAAADERRSLVVAGWTRALSMSYRQATRELDLSRGYSLLSVPPRDGFRDFLLALSRDDAAVEIVEVDGSSEILLTVVAPAEWAYRGRFAEVLHSVPLAIDPARRRVLLRVPVRGLLGTLREIDRSRVARVEHIYDS